MEKAESIAIVAYGGNLVVARDSLRDTVARALQAVRNEERERCAKICDDRMYDFGCVAGDDAIDFVRICSDLATAIRNGE